MPTLRFGKVWQVIHHFGVVLFCNLGTPKPVISNFVTTRQILLPHILPHVNMTTPTMFPVDKKASGRQKSLPQKCINSLVSHNLSHDCWFVATSSASLSPSPSSSRLTTTTMERDGFPPTPASAFPIPSTSHGRLHHRLLFSPYPPPSRLVVSSVVAPDPDDDDDDKDDDDDDDDNEDDNDEDDDDDDNDDDDNNQRRQ
jgi:hypothetical protein